ncbi:MAG: sporulation protein YqfD [Oscillospiraceae bacterium]
MISKVKFDVAAGLYCEFLNYLVANDFYISNISGTNFGFTATCRAKDYRKIARAAKKFQCRTKVLQRKGVYFKFKGILQRKGIVLGAILLIFLLAVYNNIIWEINIVTQNPSIRQDIHSLLYSMDIYVGNIYSRASNKAAIQEIFMKVDDIGYVTLNFHKGILTCKIDEKIEKLPYLANQFNGDIIATADGIITDLRVYKGFSMVQLGQVVAKGDVLVSAVKTNKREQICQVLPRAYIKAYGTKLYVSEVDLEKEVYIRNGNVQKQITLKLLGNNIAVKKADVTDINGWDKVTRFEYLKFMGFKIPATIETTLYYEKERCTISRNEEITQQMAYNIIQKLIQKDCSVIETEAYEYYVEKTDNSVRIYCTVFGYFDITK